MRLREIQKVINENLSGLNEFETEEFTRSGKSHVKIKNYKVIWKSATKLLQLNLFENERKIITDNNLFLNVSTKEASFNKEQFKLFTSVINRISYKSEAIHDLISQNLENETESERSLIVSFPTRELTIEEFAEINETLYETFRMMAILKDFNAEVTVENFDVGTSWIVLSFISTTAVALLGKLINVIQKSQVGNRQIKALDKQLESIELDEEVRNQVRKAQIEANTAIYKKLTSDFLESNNLETNSEIITQMTKVTENIDKVLSQGVGFEASVSASNEVSKTFPSLQEQKLLDQTKVVESLKSISHNETGTPE